MALNDEQYDLVYGINPQSTLSNFSDCIVVGNKNLDDITVEVQKVFENAQQAVDTFLSSESTARTSIANAKKDAEKDAEEETPTTTPTSS